MQEYSYYIYLRALVAICNQEVTHIGTQYPFALHFAVSSQGNPALSQREYKEAKSKLLGCSCEN